ncbi:hypothetical protein RBB79_02000 [Tunturiibacter empetritectus]|uniref:Uncharacterized protein n=1 Tax=Tunturiibacter lichenicola TaxID=2051959 RepID=A0A852V5G4_9BACT|nr:hypothetical protein [Edaphobacter lichenicola]NYF88268.1 hypothetical protein [Edaphobacter lichenicola]
MKTIDPLLPGTRLAGEPMAERTKSPEEPVPELGPTEECGELPDPQPIIARLPITLKIESDSRYKFGSFAIETQFFIHEGL